MIRGIACSLLLLVLIGGCKPNKQAATRSAQIVPGGVLHLPLEIPATHFKNSGELMASLSDSRLRSVANCIEMPLVRSSVGREISGIAESWKDSEARLGWVFQCPSGIDPELLVNKWEQTAKGPEHPLRSQLCDLIQGANDYRLGKSERIEGLRILDINSGDGPDHAAVEITLNRDFSEFPKWLSSNGLGIVDSGSAFFAIDIDNGTLVLSANAEHLPNIAAPHLTNIEYVFEPDRHKQFELYKEGKLDTCNLTPEDLAIVKEDPELSKQLHEFDTAATLVAFIDHGGHPWADSEFKDKTPLRQAINHALYREELAEQLGGQFTPWPHFMPKALDEFIDPAVLTSPLYEIEPNFDAAKAGLAAAGHDQGALLPRNMLLTYIEGDPLLADLAIGIKDQLEEISMLMRPFPCSREEAEELVTLGSGDLWLQWVYPAYPSPDALFYPTLHSSLSGLGGNYGRLNDPDIDRLIEQAQAEDDPNARRRLYQQLETEVEKRALFLIIGSGRAAMLINPKLAGYELTPYDFDASLPAQDFSKLGFTE